MNIELTKHELIDWINQVKDYSVLEKVVQLKTKLTKADTRKIGKRDFSDGKDIIGYIAEDFNAPLDDFKEYME